MNIIFVCLGNICRSPLAEAILKKKFQNLNIDGNVESAGFESYHINESPDNRAIETAQMHGVNMAGKRARLFSVEDFDRFDRIYVMDLKNYRDVKYFSRDHNDMAKVDYVMNIIEPGKNLEVPDPYYRNIEACDEVFMVLDRATDKIIEDIKS